MNQGFYLTLLVGPVVAVPAPQVVMDDLTSVQVTTTAESRTPSGFQLTFNLSNRSPLHTLFLLAGGSVPPVLRVILVATIDGTPEVLIDGVITRQDVSPGSTAGMSTLTVTGVDLTAVMNWIDFSGFPFPAMPAEARVLLMIAKYAMFGIIPLVVPSVLLDVPIPTKEIPRQKGTDLRYIQELADDVGYVFYLKPGPAPGTNVAYWGPEIKVGVPQRALNTNMDAETNVESLTFNFNAESATLPVLLIYNQETKAPIPIPIPDITPLNPPLGLVPPLPKNIEWIEGTGKYGPVRAALIGLAKAARSADAVSGSGTLDVLRYGRPLRARELVGVRGAGPAFDGLHYVKSVTHNIKRGEYKQSFTLARNGLISTLPTVPA
ncbi:MAG TPA: hypothetical protein VHR45_02555 [Thermoanaerobaculia bacterium]|nr:hypothetical protein [Thermoanaerobaculia bacterium]